MPRCHVSPARPRRRPSPAPCGADTSLCAPGEGAEKPSNSSQKCPGGAGAPAAHGLRDPRGPGQSWGGGPAPLAPLHFSLQRFPRSPLGLGAPLGAQHPPELPLSGRAKSLPSPHRQRLLRFALGRPCSQTRPQGAASGHAFLSCGDYKVDPGPLSARLLTNTGQSWWMITEGW